VRDHRRKPYLQKVDIAPAPSNAAGGQADDDAASLPRTAGVLDEQRVAEIDEHRECRVRDHLKLDWTLRLTAEPGHADPGHVARR
jgi:hypothetical protein